MVLSKRLQTVAGAVTPGKRIADIGTDHGYVPIYLVESGICPGGFAMDVNKGPLLKAEDHIREKGLSKKIETRLSNGLTELKKGEADSIVIAGMGGELICKILGACSWLLTDGPELILQPQAEWFKVRHWLHDHHYEISREWFLKEEGKYYVVIKALKKDEVIPYETETDYLFGKLLTGEKNPVLKEYLFKELSKKEKVLLKISGMEKQAKRVTELKEEQKIIKDVLKKME